MLVLIVDDIEKNRLLLARYLKTKAYDVLLASSGAEAIELVKEQEIDLILMDIKMPDMDGYEAARQIKSISSVNYLPVIFVSALSEDDALEEALAAGGDDYITKPVSFSILISKISAHQRIRELHKEVNRQNEELNEHNRRLQREHTLVSHFFDQARKKCFFDEGVIKSVSLPMETFNGDTVLVGRRPNGGITMLVGDFTGHGLAAAVGTLPVSQIFFKMLEDNAYIGDIAKEINRQISFLLPVEMFLAASLIELSAKGDRLMIWHGGMPDAYLYNQRTKDIITIKSQHLPLGVRGYKDFSDEVQLFYVNEDNKLIVMTDGLSEAINTENRMIDSDEYKKSIIGSADITEGVLNKYKEYSEGVARHDDISLLELSCVEVKRNEVSKSTEADHGTIPWSTHMIIEDDMLKKEPVQNIINMIAGDLAIKNMKGVVHTLLMEMYNNALDHGILGLDGSEKHCAESFDQYYREREKLLQQVKSVFIKVSISHVIEDDASVLKIEMSHNGNTFDVSESNACEGDLYGRGMALIEAICKDVSYSDDGRCLSISVAL
ncbi:MAG: response regulator [Gammaproteobacteria bacterium]|nr:response regulator [Gammaproteobacteria bacterium]